MSKMAKILLKDSILFDLATAISIVTLNYIQLFRRLLFASEVDSYYLPVYGFYDYLGAFVIILGLSILCFLAIQIIRKIAYPALTLLASLFVFLALLNPLQLIISTLGLTPVTIVYLYSTSPVIIKIAFGIFVILCVTFSVRFYWPLFRAVRMLFVITFPFAALVILQLSWYSITSLAVADTMSESRGPNIDLPEAKASDSSEGSRVLVLVFDELDYRLAFPERPQFVRLPELDRFSKQAIEFTNALPLSSNTMEAIPALLVGKRVSKVTIADRETIVLNFEGSEDGRSLSSMQNLFSETHKSGKTLSIVGFYHPYCRLFRRLYTDCLVSSHLDHDVRLHRLGKQVDGSRIFSQKLMNMFLQGIPGTKVGRIWNHGVILQHVRKTVSRFEENLIFIHLALPHTPVIFNANTGRMRYFNISPLGYFDNLVLTDNFLGEIRRTMEEMGSWDSTAVLITSDHPWRKADRYDGKIDPRIPLLIKMPGQKESTLYEKEFSAEYIKDLVLNILAKEGIDPASVVAWLEKR